ncbi:cobalamin biosynthesis protein CbiD [Lachnospiraceae bacterium JC7]|nr:cobalamin biosynthesis protein CbiD [Lachnospiraceae bacterium JC7]
MDRFVRKNQKELRCGLTTGTCAAACGKAAMLNLLTGQVPEMVNITLPGGDTVSLKVQKENSDQFLSESLESEAFQIFEKVSGKTDNNEPCDVRSEDSEKAIKDFHCSGNCQDDFNGRTGGRHCSEFFTVKDSGDDPDVTNGTEIHVRIEEVDPENVPKHSFCCEGDSGLFLTGGKGVGVVTKPGLHQNIGESAINPVPREMIFGAVKDVIDATGNEEHREIFLITVIVPEGEELAKKTFNPMLGIEGGISILGTTGIVEPMSEASIVATIETEIRQKLALSEASEPGLIAVPGNYGKRYAEELGFDPGRCVTVSNYIGEAIDLAISYGCGRFLLIGNVGKLVKLAAGIMNTHSKVADGRWEIFAAHLALCGGTTEQVRAMREAATTEEMLTRLEEMGLREKVMASIMKEVEFQMEHRIKGKMEFGVIVYSERFGMVGQCGEAAKTGR